MPESQNTEWKQSWNDKYLEWVCAFANADGGVLQIGKDDNGNVVGVRNSARLLEDIPNKIRSIIGLSVEVKLQQAENGDFIEIDVPAQSVAVSHRGHYYFRTGRTKVELTGASLNEFLLKKAGRTWDASIEERASLEDIDPKSIDRFLTDASKTGRLPDVEGLSVTELLEKLRLIQSGKLTNAAIILFGKDPMKFFPGFKIQIGKFGFSDADLQFQEVVESNLVVALQETIQQLSSKFLIKPIRFEGIQRIESLQYPIEALREILLNAMVHRRYQSGVHIQIRVYDDRLMVWNEGPLPATLSVESLFSTHSSFPRNPLIAETCFKAGYIDSWGRGIRKITEACSVEGLPDPLIEDVEGGVRVTMFGTKSGPSWDQAGTKLPLSQHQVEILRKCLESSNIGELMKLAERKDRTKFRHQVLNPLIDANLISMTIPDKPTSSKQKYLTLELGIRFLSDIQ